MRYNTYVMAVFILFVMFGMELCSDVYQLQLVRYDHGDSISLGPVGFSTPAADTFQYIDAVQTTTYGTITNGPPDGMGVDSDGPSGDTEILEASFTDSTYTQLEYTGFGSAPSGWTFTAFTVSGGYATADTTAGTRAVITKAYDLTSYDGARLVFSHRSTASTYEYTDWKIYKYTGSWADVTNIGSGSATWDTEDVSVTSSYSAFQFKIEDFAADSDENIQTDNWYIYGITETTCYRLEVVLRFDSVTTGLASYALYIDFYTALTGSDDLDFYIGTGTDPTTLIASDKQDDFSVAVTSYITASTVYLKMNDNYRSGDTSATTMYIQRCYLYTPEETVGWYDDDWLYRKQISVVEQAGAGTNYQIPITGYYNDSTKDVAGSVNFETLCQKDFDDIRFTTSNGTTLLSYWIDNEGYAENTSAVFWVEVAADVSTTASDVKIFAYFGNDAVSDVSSGDNTMLFFDDFEDNDLNEWDVHDAQWTVQTSTVKYGTYAAYVDSDTTNRYLEHHEDYTTGIMVHQWQRYQSTVTQLYPIIGTSTTPDTYYSIISRAGSADWEFYNGTYYQWELNTVVVNTWFELEMAFDITNNVERFWLSTVSKGTMAMDDDDGTNMAGIAKIKTASPAAASRDVWVDEFYIRKFVATEPTFAAPGLIEIQDIYSPVIAATSYSPINPTTLTGLTVFAIVTDADRVEMHDVYFRAIAYPAGFDDTSYYATEIATNTWSYTFEAADLPSGVYCFVVHAVDTIHETTASYTQYLTLYITTGQMTCYIRIFDSLGVFVPYETFEVYRNGARQYTDTFSSDISTQHDILVSDRWGETLNFTTFPAGTEELVITVDIYSLKFMSWYDGFCEVNITHNALTYSEIVMPMEVVEFVLYNGTYTYSIDYLNGTTSGDYTIDMINSTGVIITGDTITDIMTMSDELWDLVSMVNVTITSTNNQVLTISIDLDNVNTTINTQLIQVLLDITNTNTTIYDQIIDLLAAVQNTNTTIYNQVVSLMTDVSNMNTTIYSQTVSILANVANLDADIAAQTITLLANISNVNSTIYAQTVEILSDISNVNSTLYAQAIEILSDISNVNSTIYAQAISILSYVLDTNTDIDLVLDPDTFHILFASFDFSDDFSHFYAMSSWHNATITVYENDVQMIAPTSELNVPILYALSTTPGTYNVSAKFVSGSDTAWYNVSYTIAELIAFKLSEWDLDLHLGVECFVEGRVLTTWENATIYVYDNGTLMVTVLEGEGGTSFYWWMAQQQGIHNIVLNITNGVDTITKTRSYFIPDWAVSGLVGRYDIWNHQENGTSLYLETNWGNCTVSVYLNGTLMATSSEDPAQVFFDRTTNVGTFNLTIVWDGGAQTYTIRNIYFTVTEEGTTYISGGIQEWYYTYEGDTYEDASGERDIQFVIGVVGIVFMSIFVGGVIMWWENRKAKDRDFRLAVAGGR